MLEVRECPFALLAWRRGAERRAVQVRAEEVNDAGGAGVRGPAAMIASEMHRGGRRPVVRAVRREQLRAPGVNTRHPGGVLDRLRTAVGEHHVVQPGRGDVDDHLRRLTAYVAHPGRGERAETVSLFLDRGDDPGMLVPYVREHQLRAEVEVTPSGVIDEEAAFAAHECRDISRGLRHPWVEDQPIELRNIHQAPRLFRVAKIILRMASGTLKHRYRDSNPGFRTENPAS